VEVDGWDCSFPRDVSRLEPSTNVEPLSESGRGLVMMLITRVGNIYHTHCVPSIVLTSVPLLLMLLWPFYK
jgi:hypothetical protein